MSSPPTPLSLTPTQKYAAGSLFALALHQAQVHQARPLGSPPLDDEERTSCASSSSSGGGGGCSDTVSEDPVLWVHDQSFLLRPVFRFLEIDSMAWPGIEETAASSPAQHHVGAFLRLLSEESDDSSSTSRDKELALSNTVVVMAQSMEMKSTSYDSKKEKHRQYEHECKEKYAAGTQSQQSVEVANEHSEAKNEINDKTCNGEETFDGLNSAFDEKSMKGATMLSHEKKVMVLYELLTACLADIADNNKPARRKGYDARHRVALRLLAAWLDIKWIEMEAMETIVAYTAMALKEGQTNDKETKSPRSSWAKWKRGGIIGAAAITGGALLAITGGLAAPAIAAGFGALAPTLGTIIPVIGASGFAAAASAAGTVAGSVAVAASFGAAGAGLTGSKMARRIGDVDEFEFKAIGDNHNQGRLAVEILISGFVFEEADFVRPWEGQINNLERYALQWESKNLIAVSTAIQDWLTSRLAMEFMKQGAMLTVLSTLLTALAWPATLLAATDFIDSKWTIAVDRSDKAGKLLAEVLLKGLQGYRPVTLIGFSLGARVVFKCLEYLAESEHNAGLVERVVLLGAPIPIKDENWEAVRKIVAGRFVNAYSTNDWILGVAFRASLLSKGLAGIQPINVPGIENVDVTEIIEGHSSYLWATQDILESVELDAYYPVFRSRAAKI